MCLFLIEIKSQTKKCLNNILIWNKYHDIIVYIVFDKYALLRICDNVMQVNNEWENCKMNELEASRCRRGRARSGASLVIAGQGAQLRVRSMGRSWICIIRNPTAIHTSLTNENYSQQLSNKVTQWLKTVCCLELRKTTHNSNVLFQQI